MIQKLFVVAGCLVAGLVLYFAPVRGMNPDGQLTFAATAHWDSDQGYGDWNTNKPVDTSLLATRLLLVGLVTAALAYTFRPRIVVK